MLLGQEHRRNGGFNNISSNSSVDIDRSKTDENVRLTESYEDFNKNIDDDGDDYDPSVTEMSRLPGFKSLMETERKKYPAYWDLLFVTYLECQ